MTSTLTGYTTVLVRWQRQSAPFLLQLDASLDVIARRSFNYCSFLHIHSEFWDSRDLRLFSVLLLDHNSSSSTRLVTFLVRFVLHVYVVVYIHSPQCVECHSRLLHILLHTTIPKFPSNNVPHSKDAFERAAVRPGTIVVNGRPSFGAMVRWQSIDALPYSRWDF